MGRLRLGRHLALSDRREGAECGASTSLMRHPADKFVRAAALLCSGHAVTGTFKRSTRLGLWKARCDACDPTRLTSVEIRDTFLIFKLSTANFIVVGAGACLRHSVVDKIGRGGQQATMRRRTHNTTATNSARLMEATATPARACSR